MYILRNIFDKVYTYLHIIGKLVLSRIEKNRNIFPNGISSDIIEHLVEAPNAYLCGKRAQIALAKTAVTETRFLSGEYNCDLFPKNMQNELEEESIHYFSIRFLGNSIKTEKSPCYLGVIVDAKLNGMAHVA